MENRNILYISISLLAIAVFLLAAITFGVKREVSEVEERIASMEETKESLILEQEHNSSTNTEHINDASKEEALERISAVEIGEEVVEIQSLLGDLFCTDGNVPRELVEMRIQEGPKLGKRLSELTGIDADTYQNATWKLHEDWSLELASVISYQGVTEIPVLFTMKADDEELVGIVIAKYNVSNGQLTDLERYYPGVNYDGILQMLGEV